MKLAATTEQSSRYARALKKGMQYLLGAGQLWRGEIDVAQAKTTFDVGVPEHSLVFSPAAPAAEVESTRPAAAAGAGA
jgi:hypothetical protein